MHYIDEGEYNYLQKQIDDNPKIKKLVENYLIDHRVNDNLKGFKYFVDIITINVVTRKYSCDDMQHLFNFIAQKYGLQPFSVQRQLRYTLRNSSTEILERGIVPKQIVREAFYEIRKELEKQERNS